MIILKNSVYNKIKLQADEAKEQGMNKLAKAVESAIDEKRNLTPFTNKKEQAQYSFQEMSENVHKDLWKIAATLVAYYDVENVDISKIDKTLVSWAEKLVDDLEKTLQITDTIKGPFEPKLPGEK
jgi:biopolymer transport protein ExbB/TolQ